MKEQKEWLGQLLAKSVAQFENKPEFNSLLHHAHICMTALLKPFHRHT